MIISEFFAETVLNFIKQHVLFKIYHLRETRPYPERDVDKQTLQHWNDLMHCHNILCCILLKHYRQFIHNNPGAEFKMFL